MRVGRITFNQQRGNVLPFPKKGEAMHKKILFVVFLLAVGYFAGVMYPGIGNKVTAKFA